MDSGVSRWIAFACVPLLTALCGVTYIKVVISDLHSSATPQQTGLLKALGHGAQYFGIAAGVFCDRWGASSTVLFGGLLAFIGNEFIYCILGGFIAKDFALIAACYFIGAQSQSWFDTAALTTMIDSFPPEYRGQVIGISKAMQGLSNGVLAQLYLVLFHGHPKFFLWALPFIILSLASPISVALAAIADQSIYRPPQPPPPRLIKIAYLLSTAMVLYLFILSMTQLGLRPTQVSTAAVMGLGLLYAAWGILPLLGSIDEQSDEHRWLPSGDKRMIPCLQVEGLSLQEATRMPEFYLLLFCVSVGTGSGLLLLTNMDKMIMTAAPQGTDVLRDAAIAMSLFSAGDMFGRLLAGLMPEVYRHHFPRPVCLLSALLLMALANGLLAVLPSYWALFPLCSLSGIAMGCVTTLLPCFACDLFGVERFGTIYNTLQLGCIAGFSILSLLLGTDWLAPKQYQLSPGDCTGSSCFMGLFIANCGVCLVAAVCAFAFLRRTLAAFDPMSALDDAQAAACQVAFCNLVTDMRPTFSEATTTNSYGAEDPFPVGSMSPHGCDSQSFNSELVLQSFNPEALGTTLPPRAPFTK